ncbi:MAG TPA: hypothetical protein VE596_12315 [Gaiellaceae bacterium]|jgi:hypothetical protein|nr:hypothetical protein [Gaiellaceae bacterium]
MAFIHYATKRAARRAQRVFLLGAAQFGVLAEILSAVPHAVAGCASSGAIATALGYLGVEAGHAAEDPPRRDFRTPTRSKRRRLAIETLGESPLERQTARFADEAVHSAAYLAAFVRAVERSQTAEELSVRDVVADRVAEAHAYAHRASASLLRTAEWDLPLARTLEADSRLRRDAREQFLGPRGRTLIDTPYWEKLPPKIIQLFHEAGLEPQFLAPEWDNTFPEDPIGSAARTLGRIGEASPALASGLEDWGPAAEKPETPDVFDVW